MMKSLKGVGAEPRQYDLEDRLIQYAVKTITLSEVLPLTSTGKHIGHQLLRSGTVPAAVYGEAQSAESRKDFIHKMKIALEEMRETHVWLKIIKQKPLTNDMDSIDLLLNETNELISIFVTSINTAQGIFKMRACIKLNPIPRSPHFVIRYPLLDILTSTGRLAC